MGPRARAAASVLSVAALTATAMVELTFRPHDTTVQAAVVRPVQPVSTAKLQPLRGVGTPVAATPRRRQASRQLPRARRQVVRPAAPIVRRPNVTTSALDAAIARIPTYRPGIARWVLAPQDGFWGTADWFHATLYVDPFMPRAYLYDVVVHEWSHELTVLDYGGDVQAAIRATDSYFGATGIGGAEIAADCMARYQGATWLHYTTCDNRHWQIGAWELLHGGRV